MTASMIIIGVLGLVFVAIVVILLWGIGTYNRLIKHQNRFENSFSQIKVQLQRRLDLIPNLVEIADSYMKHERETLENTIKARNQASSALDKAAANPGDPSAMKELAGAEMAMTGALGRLFAVVESYPDLKANQNMMQLHEEITSTENKVAFARQAYNDFAMVYNVERESFPPLIIARMFNFTEAALYEVQSEEAYTAPKVSFSNKSEN